MALFQHFFETTSTDDMMNEFFMGTESMGFSFATFSSHPTRDTHKLPPIEHVLEVTLAELFEGCTKKVKIKRQVVNHKNGKLVTDKREFSVDVKRGWGPGTTVTFEREGNQNIGCIPSDVVIIIAEKEHEFYDRKRNDLIYKHELKMTLKLALCGAQIALPPIKPGSKEIVVNTDPKNIVVNPYTPLTFDGFGMPLLKKPEKRGNLIIQKVKIEFPKSLKEEKIKKLQDILP